MRHRPIKTIIGIDQRGETETEIDPVYFASCIRTKRLHAVEDHHAGQHGGGDDGQSRILVAAGPDDPGCLGRSFDNDVTHNASIFQCIEEFFQRVDMIHRTHIGTAHVKSVFRVALPGGDQRTGNTEQ